MAAKKKVIQTYGLKFSGLSQFDYERIAFLRDTPLSEGGLGRFQHFKNMAETLFEWLEWNEWLEKQIRSLCEERWICWPGAAAAGKTFSASLYAVIWWLCEPNQSSVILTSTTGKSLRRRAWAEISRFYTAIPGPRLGNFVDSQTMWQCRKGDDRHAIFGIAVHDGNMQKAVDNIKGVHTKRQLVIIDEATSTPEAIFEAATNLFGYPEHFQMLVIGNPYSRFDPMGRFAEPFDGWATVSVDTDEWETVKKMDGSKGVCIRFDALKSPNIVSGKVVAKHLVTKEKYYAAKQGLGEESPRFWSEYRGFWPPDGLAKTVFNETLIISKGGKSAHPFLGGNVFVVGGLDPAFGGGDRPVLRFARCGEIYTGKFCIQLEEPVILKVSAADKNNDNHFQLADQVAQHCEKRGCLPKNFSVDATGEGGGLCNILGRTWSNDFIKVEFGGKPSDLPVNMTDRRKCSDVYLRRDVELWFNAKEYLLSGQLKGLDAATIIELCARFFEDVPGKRISLEPKSEVKKRLGRSPDFADATILCVYAARMRGVTIEGKPVHTESNNEWNKLAVDAHSIFEGESYLEPHDFAEA